MPPTSSHASTSPVMRSTSWPAACERRLDLGAEEEVGDERGDARHHCERRRRNSRRADSGRPHICTTSTRPLRTSRTASSPVMPGVVEQLERAVHRGHRRGVAEAVRHQQPPVPVVARVGLRVAGDEVQRGVDVARLVVDAQVQLEVRPVAGERVDDLLEGVGEGHPLGSLACMKTLLPFALMVALAAAPAAAIGEDARLLRAVRRHRRRVESASRWRPPARSPATSAAAIARTGCAPPRCATCAALLAGGPLGPREPGAVALRGLLRVRRCATTATAPATTTARPSRSRARCARSSPSCCGSAAAGASRRACRRSGRG